MDFEAIRKAAEGYKPAMVKFLRDMIAIPSESCEEEGVVKRIAEELKSLGYDKVEFDKLGNVIGWMGEGDKIIAIDSHIDTVGIGNINNWEADPYKGYETEDIIYGRGGSDQEGGMAAAAYGVKIMKDLDLLPKGYKMMVVGSVQEEDCDGMCWQSIVNEYFNGPEDAREKIEFVISTEPTDGGIYRGHRGRMEIRVDMHGVSCHGSAPERGDNAIHKMAEVILNVRDLNENPADGSTDTTVKNGVTYYVFTCEVAAKEMTSDIQAQMIGNNGEKKGTVHTYTVKEYADYILSHMSAEESDISKATIQLVKGMLNYGGAAQKYFGYKTDKLASDGLTLTGAVFNDTSIINIITNDANKASVTYDNAKVTFKSAYLSLNSTTDLCVSVQFADDVTVKEDMFAIRCNTDQISKDQYEVTKVNEENCYKITLHGVKASQLNEKYAFCVELSDTEYAELAYGTNSYAYTVMSSACDNISNIESLREVVKALYAYGSCAQEYEYYKNDGNN